MQPFTVLSAIAAPLPWPNVNTDDIFPSAGAGSVALGPEMFQNQELLARNAFAYYRFDEDGSPKPDFVLNQPPYDEAKILITLENFGCGSSREHAVWSLAAIGLRCIIAPSFGDIFYNNCVKNGLLPARMSPADTHALLDIVTAHPDADLTVDLAAQTVTSRSGDVFVFEISTYQRSMLLDGVDEISVTLNHIPDIEAHELAYLRERPWLAVGGSAVETPAVSPAQR
jgi:3-isopropylmalate/(R)-2-methylmalate dehydratase small subunit